MFYYNEIKGHLKNQYGRASLVAQWWRIHLPVQETQVRSLVQEDPTCCRAARPMCHNFGACALEPGSCSYWSSSALEPVLRNKGSCWDEKPSHHTEESPLLDTAREKPVQQLRSSTAKNEYLKKINMEIINKIVLFFFFKVSLWNSEFCAYGAC